MRYLAQLRKQGMDLLFPRCCMDTVLSAIWTAVSAQGALPLAHRELIDIVIFAKENGALAAVDAVSKTKVRGILALLKHGEILDGKHALVSLCKMLIMCASFTFIRSTFF